MLVAQSQIQGGALTGSVPSGIDGGGFVNAVAFDPAGRGVALAGGDVSGFHRSSSYGASGWRAANRFAGDVHELHVASIVWSAGMPGTAYAGTGRKGSAGGFYRTRDGGLSWTRLSTAPQFGGGNNDAPLPTTHPRSTGNLIALDEGARRIYALTFSGGLMRSTDGGTSWSTIGLAGRYGRSLVVDPGDPGTLFASTYETSGGSVWKITDAAGSAAATRLVKSPNEIEDLLVLGDTVYAAGRPGIYARPVAGGDVAWSTRLGIQRWLSLAGYVAPGGTHVLYAGSYKAEDADLNGMYESLKKSSDGGLTWTNLTNSPRAIGFTVAGRSSLWWLPAGSPQSMLGRLSYVASQIAIDPSDRSRLMVSGRSGVWRSIDEGANWTPAVKELNVTINRSIGVDPNDSTRVYVGNTDWVVLQSTDALGSVRQERTPTGTRTIDIAFDCSTSPSRVFVATDADAAGSGEVWSKHPADPGWTSERLKAATGGRRPLGIALGLPAGGVRPLLAAVEGKGVMRRKETGKWRVVSGNVAASAQPTGLVPMTWRWGGGDVYLFDRKVGVYRSTDSGTSWTRIWQVTSNVDRTGYLAHDPSDSNAHLVSTMGGLYRLTSVRSGTVESGAVTATKLAAVANPGPVVVDWSGRIWVATYAVSGTPAALVRSSNDGASWETLSDRAWEDTAGYPQSLAVGGGVAHAALQGDGAISR
ncbi:MAG: hypothetical protein ACRDJ4_16065 [Actinomycetota bacterium]